MDALPSEKVVFGGKSLTVAELIESANALETQLGEIYKLRQPFDNERSALGVLLSDIRLKLRQAKQSGQRVTSVDPTTGEVKTAAPGFQLMGMPGWVVIGGAIVGGIILFLGTRKNRKQVAEILALKQAV